MSETNPALAQENPWISKIITVNPPCKLLDPWMLSQQVLIKGRLCWYMFLWVGSASLAIKPSNYLPFRASGWEVYDAAVKSLWGHWNSVHQPGWLPSAVSGVVSAWPWKQCRQKCVGDVWISFQWFVAYFFIHNKCIFTNGLIWGISCFVFSFSDITYSLENPFS